MKLFWSKKNLIPLISAFIAACCLIPFCKAGALPDDWSENIEDIDELVQVDADDGVDMIKKLITYNAIPLFKYLFVAISILYFTISLFIMANADGNEEDIKKHRTAMLWGLLGLALIALSAEIANIFDPLKNSEIGSFTGTKTVAQKFISYLQLILGTICTIFIFFAGYRFITRGEDEEIITKAKKEFIWSFTGLVIAILADPIVNKVFYPASGAPGDAEVQELSTQIMGLLKFVLSFMGVLILISFLVSAGFFLTSFGEEERHSKAKKILYGSLIGIIIIASSYAIIATFASPNSQ